MTATSHVSSPAASSLAGIAAYAAPLGRVLLSILFINAGWSKIAGYAGTAGYMASKGLPEFLLPAVIAVEFLGGLLLLVGYQTRLVAFLIAGFTVIASLIFHNFLLDPTQQLMFWKNMSITGGLLFVVAHGAGPLSIDARRG